jgi:hypothetical protein
MLLTNRRRQEKKKNDVVFKECSRVPYCYSAAPSSPIAAVVVVSAVISSSVDLIVSIIPGPSKIIKKKSRSCPYALMCVHFMEKFF